MMVEWKAAACRKTGCAKAVLPEGRIGTMKTGGTMPQVGRQPGSGRRRNASGPWNRKTPQDADAPARSMKGSSGGYTLPQGRGEVCVAAAAWNAHPLPQVENLQQAGVIQERH